MRFTIYSILSLAVMATAAQVPQKNIIVSYDDNVPQSVIDQAMDAVKNAGGMITHEYNLIKGFAAKAPAKILESIQTMGNDYHATIEEDQMVTIVGGNS